MQEPAKWYTAAWSVKIDRRLRPKGRGNVNGNELKLTLTPLCAVASFILFSNTLSIVDKCAFIYRMRLLFCELRALLCVFLCRRPSARQLEGKGSGSKWGEGVWKWAHMSNAMSNWIKLIKNEDTKAPKTFVVVAH